MRAVKFLLFILLTFTPLLASDLREERADTTNMMHLSSSLIMIKPSWYSADATKSRVFKFSYDNNEHSYFIEMRLRYNDSPFPGEKEPLLGEIIITLDRNDDYEIYAIKPQLYFLQACEKDLSQEQLRGKKAKVKFKLGDRKMLTFYASDSLKHQQFIKGSHYLRFSADVFLLKQNYEFSKTKSNSKPTLSEIATRYLPWKGKAYLKSPYINKDVSVEDIANTPSIDIYESWDENSDSYPLKPKYLDHY